MLCAERPRRRIARRKTFLQSFVYFGFARFDFVFVGIFLTSNRFSAAYSYKALFENLRRV
jgi:hypothetical protein